MDTAAMLDGIGDDLRHEAHVAEVFGDYSAMRALSAAGLILRSRAAAMRRERGAFDDPLAGEQLPEGPVRHG